MMLASTSFISCSRIVFIRFFATLILVLASSAAFGQSVNLENIGSTFKQKPVRVGGGISANTVFYDGNDGQGRQPFTYFLNGNINFSLFNQVNLPFSFCLTNVGSNYGYPTLPNRLSVHPTYKWITGHLGTVNMSFSPYTLNGHMFTGAGVDLSPKGPFKVSAMYGRMQRAVEYDSGNLIVPAAYQRMGYGAKVRFDKEKHFLGMTFFAAEDDPSSLQWQPDSLQILPQKNAAFSWEGGITLGNNLNIASEYGISLITRDVRSPSPEGPAFIEKILNSNTSTHVYRAFKTEINYQFLKNVIGVGYERIDPEYRTLGAYYFNNDYENITLKYARPFLKDKASVAMSWGFQRDDLNHDKEQSSKRFVSSASLNYAPNERVNASLSYSGFQTYMNIKSQFDYINGQTPYDNLDTLDFTQLSQNLSLNMLYNFGKNQDRRHSLNTSVSFQEAADKQGDVIRQGAVSQFYNLCTSYGLLLVPQAIHVQAALNATYNKIGGHEFVIVGPTVGFKARLLKKTLTTGVSASHNVSYNDGDSQSTIMNLRWNCGVAVVKKHLLSANVIWQKRDMASRPETFSVTATVGYSYSF